MTRAIARLPRVLGALGFALAVSAWAPDASAFCRSTTCAQNCERDFDGCKTTGEKLFWPTQCVGFSLQRESSIHIPFSVFETISQASFLAWADVTCESGIATMAFSQQDSAVCHLAEYNTVGENANIIMFQDNKWTYKGVDNTLAKTTVSYDTTTGEIFDADIELNHAYNEFTIVDPGDGNIVYDLQSILTHEVGHFIGIDHTQDFLATMNAGYEQGTTDLRTIELDDADAVCDAYPPGRDVKCNTTPNGGFSILCDDPEALEDDGGDCAISPAGTRRSGRGALALLGLGVALVAARRRASRFSLLSR